MSEEDKLQITVEGFDNGVTIKVSDGKYNCPSFIVALDRDKATILGNIILKAVKNYSDATQVILLLSI